MTTKMGGRGRTGKSQVESKTSDGDDIIDDSNLISVPPATAPESTATVTRPKFSPHYLLSEWEVVGSEVRRISIAIWLASGVDKADYSYNLAECSSILELRIHNGLVYLLIHFIWTSTGCERLWMRVLLNHTTRKYMVLRSIWSPTVRSKVRRW